MLIALPFASPVGAEPATDSPRFSQPPAATETNIQGFLEVVVTDFLEPPGSETRYTLRTDENERIRLRFDSPPRFRSGVRMEVSCEDAGAECFVTDYVVVSEAIATSEPNPNLGQQNIVVILINTTANPIENITHEEVADRVFSPSNPLSLQWYVNEVSYGKASTTGIVVGWYTLDFAEEDLCSDALYFEAIAAADGDVDFSVYNRLFVSWPDEVCSFAARGSVGFVEFETDDGLLPLTFSLFNGTTRIIQEALTHEFGHNLGLLHASDWECGATMLGEDCRVIPVDDQFDVMGRGNWPGHYSAWHKEIAGWLDPEQIAVAEDNEIYWIEPLETVGTGIKSLKIPISESKFYYVEYRRPIGLDADNHAVGQETLSTDVFAGAMVRGDMNPDGGTDLLDHSPDSEPDTVPQTPVSRQVWDSFDVVVREHRTFHDPDAGVSFRVIEVTDDHLGVWVNPPEGIPAASDWGMVILTLLLLSSATIVLRGRLPSSMM